jgi:hypothetical protein
VPVVSLEVARLRGASQRRKLQLGVGDVVRGRELPVGISGLTPVMKLVMVFLSGAVDLIVMMKLPILGLVVIAAVVSVIMAVIVYLVVVIVMLNRPRFSANVNRSYWMQMRLH